MAAGVEEIERISSEDERLDLRIQVSRRMHACHMRRRMHAVA
jgi:hypothetical protein